VRQVGKLWDLSELARSWKSSPTEKRISWSITGLV
jgi:hypothetical protein